ncbi:hypothetical protein F25303_3421 [Fusarium sp. NRRL 25303]|nr:hypothetical protein F25303_3421 [Fusarium sp. NRRL 25303]
MLIGTKCPVTGELRVALRRIAVEIQVLGEYDDVEILSNPKTQSGGRKTAIHFKVLLRRRYGRSTVRHEALIKLVHRNASGPKDGPPKNCPRAKREAREKELAEALEVSKEAETETAPATT